LILIDSAAAVTSQWNWLRAKAEEKMHVRQTKPAEAVFQQEMNTYLEEPNVPMPVLQHSGESENCSTYVLKASVRAESLHWGSKHYKAFPQLARLARISLSIPAMSVSSERIFSKTGLQLFLIADHD
jgi:hypothetical protein